MTGAGQGVTGDSQFARRLRPLAVSVRERRCGVEVVDEVSQSGREPAERTDFDGFDLSGREENVEGGSTDPQGLRGLDGGVEEVGGCPVVLDHWWSQLGAPCWVGVIAL